MLCRSWQKELIIYLICLIFSAIVRQERLVDNLLLEFLRIAWKLAGKWGSFPQNREHGPKWTSQVFIYWELVISLIYINYWCPSSEAFVYKHRLPFLYLQSHTHVPYIKVHFMAHQLHPHESLSFHKILRITESKNLLTYDQWIPGLTK